MSTPSLRIGIDFGGTKTEVIALDGSNGKELFKKRVPSVRDYAQTLQTFKDLTEEAENVLGTKGTLGIGISRLGLPRYGACQKLQRHVGECPTAQKRFGISDGERGAHSERRQLPCGV